MIEDTTQTIERDGEVRKLTYPYPGQDRLPPTPSLFGKLGARPRTTAQCIADDAVATMAYADGQIAIYRRAADQVNAAVEKVFGEIMAVLPTGVRAELAQLEQDVAARGVEREAAIAAVARLSADQDVDRSTHTFRRQADRLQDAVDDTTVAQRAAAARLREARAPWRDQVLEAYRDYKRRDGAQAFRLWFLLERLGWV